MANDKRIAETSKTIDHIADGGKKVELLPCPFCGRTPSKVKEHHAPGFGHIYYSVACKAPLSKCFVKPSTGMHKTPEGAIEAWNRRVGDTT